MRSLIFMVIVLAILAMPHACSKERSCENCITKEGKVYFYTLNGCVNSRPIKLIINDREYLVEQANFLYRNAADPG